MLVISCGINLLGSFTFLLKVAHCNSVLYQLPLEAFLNGHMGLVCSLSSWGVDISYICVQQADWSKRRNATPGISKVLFNFVCFSASLQTLARGKCTFWRAVCSLEAELAAGRSADPCAGFV